jgi:hypothetical protein
MPNDASCKSLAMTLQVEQPQRTCKVLTDFKRRALACPAGQRVRVERDARLRVSKALTDGFNRRAGLEEQRRMRVPHIVQANARHTGRRDNRLVIAIQVVRIDKPADARGKDEIIIFPGRRL